MSESVNANKRRSRHDDADQGDGADDGPASRKRRSFLQTMGQQLREYGPQASSPRDYNRGTFGTSPRTHGGPPTAGSSHATEARNLIDTPESDAAPGEADTGTGNSQSASRWLWQPHEVLASHNSTTTAHCNFQDLLDWSQNYFDHWHPAFPFIHAPSILDFFRQIAQNDLAAMNSASEMHCTMLRAIISVSLMDARQKSTRLKAVPPMLVFHSYRDAIDSVRSVLVEETSILSLQTLVSVQVFLISMLRYNAASRLEGLAVRMAFQLHLHHCPVRLGGDAASEAELRKRLFWSIFCIDRYICIRLGIPLGINSSDVDVCYPHSEKHGPEKPNEERDHRLDLLDFLARHAVSIFPQNTHEHILSAAYNTRSEVEVHRVSLNHWLTVSHLLIWHCSCSLDAIANYLSLALLMVTLHHRKLEDLSWSSVIELRSMAIPANPIQSCASKQSIRNGGTISTNTYQILIRRRPWPSPTRLRL